MGSVYFVVKTALASPFLALKWQHGHLAERKAESNFTLTKRTERRQKRPKDLIVNDFIVNRINIGEKIKSIMEGWRDGGMKGWRNGGRDGGANLLLFFNFNYM